VESCSHDNITSGSSLKWGTDSAVPPYCDIAPLGGACPCSIHIFICETPHLIQLNFFLTYLAIREGWKTLLRIVFECLPSSCSAALMPYWNMANRIARAWRSTNLFLIFRSTAANKHQYMWLTRETS